VSGTPEEFGAFVKSELTKWQAVAKNANVKVQ
jgi:tripartite-type tricarboxylate transporter receptor subunit TctC